MSLSKAINIFTYVNIIYLSFEFSFNFVLLVFVFFYSKTSRRAFFVPVIKSTFWGVDYVLLLKMKNLL